MPKPIAALCVSLMICIVSTHVFTKSFFSSQEGNIIDFVPESDLLAIICPVDITVQVPETGCIANVIIPTPVSDDLNCPIISLSNSLTGISDPSGDYAAQHIELIWTVEDDCGQDLQCVQQIFIVDEIPPSLTCPPDITTGNSDDGRNTMVIVDSPIASDNCMLESVLNDYNDTPDASDIYPIGTTLVNWTAQDTSGNETTCQMSVIVFDNTPPQFFCPDEEQYDCLDALPTPFATYEDFELAGGDAIDETGLDTASFSLLEETSDGMFCPETITRIYVISDAAGNSSTCSQEIIISDDESPVIPTPSAINDINCNDPLPAPQTLIASDNCGNVDVVVEVLPYTANSCNGYTITYRWTAQDACGNQAIPVTASFMVLPDTEVPSITPPQNITVFTENGVCEANVTVPLLVVSDNCNSFSIQNNYNNTNNASDLYVVGTTLLVWTVSDMCGNTSTVEQSVTVLDNQGPDMVCKTNVIVALNDFLDDLVPASYFVESVTDNCGGNISLVARRMNVSCNVPDSDDFNVVVPFCCSDVADEAIMVEIKATDERNQMTTCMVEVDVQDNIAPIVHDVLPDISISCEFPLDLDNLSVFGTYVAEGQTRGNIIIDDYFYQPSGNAGMDGVYFDNCPDITISVDTSMFLDRCNRGRIERLFTFTDAMGLQAEALQTIYIIDVDPFSLEDIIWPQQNVYLNDCNVVVPDADITGRPVLTNDKCSMAAATFKDLTFPNNAYCKVIRRTWTVLDWCQYVPNNPAGRWTFEQFIYITNDIAPVIDPAVCAASTICTPNGSCTGQLNFSASGSDDCLPVQITWSYKIDEGNNNTIDFTGTGANINRSISRGIHKIIWEAKDKCGNLATCQKIVTIKECKAPTGVVHHGLSVNLTAQMAMASVASKNFNNGSHDNCTPAGALKFSYSTQINDTIRTFDCNHLGQQPLEIWVTDLEGNQTIVHTYIVVQDNDGLCGNMNRITFSGTVRTIDKHPLCDTKIMIEGGETYADQMTKADGLFDFQNLGMYNDYRVMGEKTNEVMRGVSTLDLVLIQRHILEIERFKDPVQFLAGDIDESGKINTLDLVNLRKLILGVVDTFPNLKPWVFVKEKQQYLNKENPWHENLDYEFNNVDSSYSDLNFTAVKVGDVNHSYYADSLRVFETRSKNLPTLIIEDKNIAEGELISIPFKASHFNNILAQQFTIKLPNDVEYSGFEAKALPLNTDQISFVEKNGNTYITVAYHDIQAMTFEDGTELFALHLSSPKNNKVSKILELCNDVTPSKVYDEQLKSKPLRLDFIAPTGQDAAFVIQNQPNPFKDETSLLCQVTKHGYVELSLFDGSGKLIFKGNYEVWPGQNRMILGQKELKEARGVIFAKIKSDELNEVVKMLRIE